MRKLILTLSAVFVLILHAAAQDRTITGKVTNDKGAPIEGASITSNDGKYGTQTDKFGTYSLTIPPTVKSLNFSNVNFEGESKTVGKKVAEKALASGISQIVFDRNGFIYHGRVQALADGAREAGLSF